MSHLIHQARMEQLFEEGLEEGIAKGLEGQALDFFAERYAKKALSQYDWTTSSLYCWHISSNYSVGGVVGVQR